MHAWAPEYIQRVYPRQRDLHVDALLSSTEAPGEPPPGTSSLLGFMAMMASEVGDTETVDRILDHADTYYRPVWREGRYYYPRNDGPVSEEDDFLSVTATAGNAMLPFARLNPGNGLLRLHNETWPETCFEHPHIAAVDLGAVGVSQAFYDAEREALVVGLEPSPPQLAETPFEVRNLDRAATWDLFRHGAFVATIAEGARLADLGIEWPKGGPFRVSVDATAPLNLVLRKSPEGKELAGL